MLPLLQARVPSLVGEQRSHLPHGKKKKKREREKEKSRNPASREVERGILGGGNRLFKGPEVGEDQP